MVNFKLKQRVLFFIAYLALLLIATKLAIGNWLPPSSKEGVWLYSGIFALLLGGLIESPFFTKPKGAFSFSWFALAPLILYGEWAKINEPKNIIWLISTIYVSSVIFFSFISIVGYESSVRILDRLGDAGYEAIKVLGGPRAIFSSVFLSALAAFHASAISELVYLLIAWIAVAFSLLERIFTILIKLIEHWKSSLETERIGEVVGHTVPGLLTVEHPTSVDIETGNVLLVPGDEQEPNLGIALGHVGIGDGLRLQVLQLSVEEEIRNDLPKAAISDGRCALIEDSEIDTRLNSISDYRYENRDRLVGIVSPGTTTQELKFEVVRSETELEEGRLIEVNVNGEKGLYQVTDGVTREETTQRENKRGYAEAKAKKIGHWNHEEEYFSPITWLPEPNCPVFLVEEQEAEIDYEAVGYFPQTAYPVSLDIDSIVTHNSAIIGILGIGKSYLSLELTEKMLSEDINVISIDLTNQYRQELDPYYNENFHQWANDQLEAAAGGREDSAENPEEGGAVQDFQAAMDEVVEMLICNDEHDENLLILDPSSYEVWKQTGGEFQGSAKMASLTPAHITRIIAQSALKISEQKGMTDSARCCLVFEEAHSLIPEFTAVASEGDKEATNGTARAILQGRKYGLGCLVVTQRTASVTKTVLNQCNTIFSMRVYDDTGMDFLSNYIGNDYAEKLSDLDDRHMIVSGKASSCRGPVQVRVNDREDFLDVARQKEDD